MIKSALGGILLIDEAYILNDRTIDHFNEVKLGLLKSMDNYKGLFVTIAAGYPSQMSELIANNPGLNSRFSVTINFDDYTAEELSQMFFNKATAEGFKIENLARAKVLVYFNDLVVNKDEYFGNAREVNKFFEQVIKNKSNRLCEKISKSEPISDEESTMLYYEDFP